MNSCSNSLLILPSEILNEDVIKKAQQNKPLLFLQNKNHEISKSEM